MELDISFDATSDTNTLPSNFKTLLVTAGLDHTLWVLSLLACSLTWRLTWQEQTLSEPLRLPRTSWWLGLHQILYWACANPCGAPIWCSTCSSLFSISTSRALWLEKGLLLSTYWSCLVCIVSKAQSEGPALAPACREEKADFVTDAWLPLHSSLCNLVHLLFRSQYPLQSLSALEIEKQEMVNDAAANPQL